MRYSYIFNEDFKNLDSYKKLLTSFQYCLVIRTDKIIESHLVVKQLFNIKEWANTKNGRFDYAVMKCNY